jgi:hypothetical protein
MAAASYWHDASLFTKTRIEDELKKFGVKVRLQFVLPSFASCVADPGWLFAVRF